jgi:hypothetical protein
MGSLFEVNSTNGDITTTGLITATGSITSNTGNFILKDGHATIFNDTELTPKAVTLEAPTILTNSYTLKWPLDQGIASTFLKNDGSGNLSFNTISLDDLSDVIIATPVVDQILTFNGTDWVNGNNTNTSAGNGIIFYLSDVASFDGQNTLSTIPDLTPATDSVVVTAATSPLFIEGYITSGLNRTQLDSGVWELDIFRAVTAGGLTGTQTIETEFLRRFAGTGTVTITGVGATRTCTVTGSTPFLAGDFGANITVSGHVETSSGVFPIVGFTSTSVVTIQTGAGYVNQAGVAFYVQRFLFSLTTGDIQNTAITEQIIDSVQAAYTGFALADELSVRFFATTSTGTRTIAYTHGGNTQYTHIHTPLITRHNDLAGLQGGTSNEEYHLTLAEHTVATQVATDALNGYLSSTDHTSYTTAVSQAAAALPSASFTSAAVTGKLITGFVSGSGTVFATDTILQAIDKLDGNDALKLPLAGGTLTGDLTLANAHALILKETTGNGTDAITLKAPDSVTTSYTINLPPAVGAAGSVPTDVAGNGILTWVVPSGAGTVNAGVAPLLAYYKTSTNAVSNIDADASAGSHKITNLAAGTTAGDAINYNQIATLFMYRRPVLTFSTVSTVAIETGLDSNAGEAKILFPDGEVRTNSTVGDIVFDITRNAAWTSGTIQSGLDTGSEATNTWYAIYAVKVTKVGSTSRFVAVGSTTLPLQANCTTLNTNFGANGWIYLGLIRNGDGAGAIGDILDFIQAGNTTYFKNTNNGGSPSVPVTGIRLADTASATSLTYTYSAGTGATNIPNNISFSVYEGSSSGNAGNFVFQNSAASRDYFLFSTGTSATLSIRECIPASEGVKISNGPASSFAYDICIEGFVDGVLGVGSNPLL